MHCGALDTVVLNRTLEDVRAACSRQAARKVCMLGTGKEKREREICPMLFHFLLMGAT